MVTIEVKHFAANPQLQIELDQAAEWRGQFAADILFATAVEHYNVDPSEVLMDLITVSTTRTHFADSSSDAATKVEIRIERNEFEKDMSDEDINSELRRTLIRVKEHVLELPSLVVPIPHLGRLITANELIIWPTTVANSGWKHTGSGVRALRFDPAKGTYVLNKRR